MEINPLTKRQERKLRGETLMISALLIGRKRKGLARGAGVGNRKKDRLGDATETFSASFSLTYIYIFVIFSSCD